LVQALVGQAFAVNVTVVMAIVAVTHGVVPPATLESASSTSSDSGMAPVARAFLS